MSTTTTAETPLDWLNDHPWMYGIIGAVGLGLIILVLVLICVCCYCYCKRRKQDGRQGDRESLIQNRTNRSSYGAADTASGGREPSVVEEMNRQRREQEENEKRNAKDAVEFFVRSNYRNHEVTALPDMGSRMQKYWFKVFSNATERDMTLVTIAPVSQRCPLKLDKTTVAVMNRLLEKLRGHSYLHMIQQISYIPERGQLIIAQPLMVGGSLKDIIYRATPTSDWSQKYSRRSKGVTPPNVALYGRHILEAIKFLYSKGFPPLGHVQSGNCFVVEGRCLLSGYENTLLGYKTRMYRVLKEHMDHIDVIMFGHLVFEMSCGYELTTLRPRDSDIKSINPGVRQLLEYIFEESFPHSIDDISQHGFFRDTDTDHLNMMDAPGDLTSEERSLLKTVGKGKAVAKQPKAKKSKTPVIPPPAANKTILEEEQKTKPTAKPRTKKPNN